MPQPDASTPDGGAPNPGDVPQLADPWGKRIPLDGLLEREHFPPLMMALLVPVTALVLFNFVIFPLLVVPLLFLGGLDLAQPAEAMRMLLQERTDLLLIGNGIGEALGLAAPALLVARWHSSHWKGFLRLRGSDVRLIGLAILGWGAMYPLVTWLGTLNQMIPLPDFMQQFEQQQMKLIEQVLMSDQGVAFNVLVLAVTPAVCEELLFRGYVQRQGERALGAAGGILLAGIVFGLFHLRFSQALPLVALGCYLAYLAWRTGSLVPPMLVHLANNAFAVAAGAYAQSRTGLSPDQIEQFQLSWYVVVGAVLLFGSLAFVLHRWGAALKPSRASAPTS